MFQIHRLHGLAKQPWYVTINGKCINSADTGYTLRFARRDTARRFARLYARGIRHDVPLIPTRNSHPSMPRLGTVR